MEVRFKSYYQNPKVDYLFGIVGGDPIPTKQDKFKPIDVREVNEDGSERILKDFYVKKPDEDAVQKFNSYIQESIKQQFDAKNKIQKPIEVEVILSFSITEKRYKIIDVDNLAKAVLDSLNNIVYEDDSQVVSLICSKHVHPLKINGLFIGVTRLTSKNKGFGDGIKLFSGSPW